MQLSSDLRERRISLRMRFPSTSTVSFATTASATVTAMAEAARRGLSKESNEGTSQLEANESKPRWRPRNEKKQAGRSHIEKNMSSRRRRESESDTQGHGKAHAVARR